MAKDQSKQLTPREKLKVAYLHEVRGIEQQLLADIFEVNIGRINDAIQPVRVAVGLPATRSHDGDS